MKKYNGLILVALICCLFIIPVSASVPDTRGDVNSDVLVNAKDALAVLKHVAILDTLNTGEIRRADVNRDYDCNAKDALFILQYSATLISSFDEIVETVIVKTSDVDYENVRIVRSGSKYDDSRDIRSRIISSYEEYTEYISELDNCVYYRSSSDEVDLYLPEYFENNVLFVADFWIGSGSISYKFLNVTEEDETTIISVEKYSPMMQTCDMAHWDMIVPLPGKNRNIENIKLEFDVINDFPSWYCDFTNDISSINNGENYLKIISTYEEYNEYMDLIKENNPEFTTKHKYEESDFDSWNIVAGGFWLNEGPLELKKINGLVKNNEAIINFNFICPKNHDEDTSFYTFIISYDKSSYSNISYTTDVEYYDVPDISEDEVEKLEVEVDNKWYQKMVLLNTYDEYIWYLSSIKEKAIDDFSSVSNYDEAYFEENVLVVVEYADESYSIGSSFLEIVDFEDEFIVKIQRDYPRILREGSKQWCVFIELEGKQWDKKDSRLSFEESGADEVVCRAETMWVSTHTDMSYITAEFPQYIKLSTYEDYMLYTDFINENRLYTNRASYTSKQYNDEYFKENELLLVVIDGTENRYDAEVSSKITDEGEIILNIDRAHDTKFHNNGLIWNVFVPLTGTGWVVEDVTINYTDSYPYEN